MNLKKLSVTVLLSLSALCTAHALYYYPQLPDIVATHFGATGRPDAWAPKEAFLNVYLFTLAFCTVIFLGISFTASRLPVSMINLPNKSYWLAPERKQETLDFLFHYFLWFASATILLLCDVMHQAFQVHLGRSEVLPHPVVSLACYLGFTALWIAGLLMRFGKKRA